MRHFQERNLKASNSNSYVYRNLGWIIHAKPSFRCKVTPRWTMRKIVQRLTVFYNLTHKHSSLPTFRFKNVFDSMFFVLVLSPKDGARNRSICEFDYEHEHHFIEHEHEFKLKDVGKDERVSEGRCCPSLAHASAYE